MREADRRLGLKSRRALGRSLQPTIEHTRLPGTATPHIGRFPIAASQDFHLAARKLDWHQHCCMP